MNKLILTALAGILTGSLQAIVINEIRIDQPGSDTDEYFELYGTPLASLNGLTYVVIGDTTAAGSGAIEYVLSLNGTTLDANGYFVAATASFTLGTANLTAALVFENSDSVTHLLVGGFTGALNQDLDTDNDGTLDTTPWTSIVDAVGLVEFAGGPVAAGDEWYYGASLGFTDVGPDGSFVPGHIYRLPGGGAWKIGSFTIGVDSPGTVNYLPMPTLAIAQNGANMDITFQSVSGLAYQLQESSLLASGWGDVFLASQNGTDGILTFSRPAPASPDKKFYRVDVTVLPVAPPPPPGPPPAGE